MIAKRVKQHRQLLPLSPPESGIRPGMNRDVVNNLEGGRVKHKAVFLDQNRFVSDVKDYRCQALKKLSCAC